MAASAATSTATPPTSKRSPTRPEAVRGAVTAPVTRASRSLTECRTVRDPGALADLPWDVLLDPQIHTQGPEDVHQR